MPKVDFVKLLPELKNQIKMIQKSLSNNTEVYHKRLGTPPYSIKNRTDSALIALKNLFYEGILSSKEFRNEHRMKKSGQLTQAINDLLETLDYATTQHQPPLLNKTWTDTVLLPFKQLANVFLSAEKQYTIVHTESMKSTKDTILKNQAAKESLDQLKAQSTDEQPLSADDSDNSESPDSPQKN